MYQSQIKEYFAQTENGDSRWWTWPIVVWFALICWLYGQIIFGIPMFLIAMIKNPDSMSALMEAQTQAQTNGTLNSLSGLILFASPIVAFLLWIFKDSFSGKAKRTALLVAASQVILSSVAFVYMMTSSSGQTDAQFLSEIIGASPFGYMFMLLTFPPLAIGLWLGQKHVHKRSVLSLHTAFAKFRWKRLVFAMLVFWSIAIVLSYVGHMSGNSTAEYVFDPSKFWKYLPVTLLFIPLQSATEEIALRGYLNQALGHYLKNPWVVFFITSTGFASLHLGNPEIAASTEHTSIWIAISGYFFFGFFACILTMIDGGLESAIGVHAANNIYAATIVGYESSALPTPTIFKVPLNTQLDSIMTIASLALVCAILYMTRTRRTEGN
jgi:membrane protease YdiL (CAAX protease family)